VDFGGGEYLSAGSRTSVAARDSRSAERNPGPGPSLDAHTARDASDYDDGLRHVTTKSDRVVMVRTFSKLHALAGLRVGWMYAAPRIIDLLMRARFIFPVSTVAQAAAAAALGDAAHIAASVAHNEKWKPYLAGELSKLGIETLPSGGNFLLARLPDDGWRSADSTLRDRGIIVRAVPPLEGLRVTIGTESENRAVADAFAAWRERT
jgi:histidinol-phosphate aminotransferase